MILVSASQHPRCWHEKICKRLVFVKESFERKLDQFNPDLKIPISMNGYMKSNPILTIGYHLLPNGS